MYRPRSIQEMKSVEIPECGPLNVTCCTIICSYVVFYVILYGYIHLLIETNILFFMVVNYYILFRYSSTLMPSDLFFSLSYLAAYLYCVRYLLDIC